MRCHDGFPQAFDGRPHSRLREFSLVGLAVLLAVASVPALAQYEYRRTITVDRTKVTNPALLPIAFDNVTSAKTADAGASSLSWSHTVGTGNDKLAIVSVSTAQPAITADAGTSQGGAGVSSMTFTNYTVPAGNNKALLVSVSIRNNASQTVLGVTYGASMLSLVGAINNGTNVRVELWGLVNVTPGSANLVVTLSAAANFIVGVVPFSNVASIASGRWNSATGTSTGPSVAVTSAPGELVVDTVGNLVDAAGAPTATPAGGQTANWSTVYIPSQVRGSGTRKAGASSVTMSWTLSASQIWAIGAVPLTPAGVTLVMFGGTNITTNLIGSVINTGNCAVSIYYMLNPPAGSNTVSVTMAASRRFVAGAFSFFNVSQTTPFGTFASTIDSGTGGYFAQYFVTSANGEIAFAALAKTYNDAITQRAQNQQADRWNLATADATPANNILGIGSLRGGAASASFYWDLTGASTQQIAFGGVSVKPTTVAPPAITTLSNYPMLVSLSDSTLKTVANGGHIWNASGWDIEFRASDGATKLDYEIEKYDGVNGQVVAWVRLPTVNAAGSGSNTQIYIYYGYKKIAAPTQNKTAVWDANYLEVWHLGEPSGNATDSTSHAYTATVQANPGTPTHPAAKIDGGFHFAGDSWLLTNDGQITTANTPLTFESWFYLDSVPQTWVGIVTKNRDVTPCTASPPPCDWAGIWSGGSGELAYGWDWHSQGNIDGGAVLSAATWYYAVLTFDGGIRTGFRNGARDTTPTQPNPSPGTYSSLTMPTRIDSDLTGGANIVGTIDEVRVSTMARSPGWILTSYNNMNNPGNIGSPGFYTVGNEDFLRFSYRRLITLSDSMTPASCSSNLANFPVLVSIANDATLKTVANGGHVQNANGYDIDFRALDEVTLLDHEIESYDGSTGTLVAWVRIPTLAYNAATAIYMYYGNPGVSAATANPTGVWGTNYKAVWHLSESSGTLVRDSTSYANNGTKLSATQPNPAAGKIAGAQNFNGTTDVIDINNSSGVGHVLDLTSGPFTISAWFNQPVAQVRHMVGKRDGANDQYQFGVGSYPDVFFSGDGEEGYGSTLSLNTWYYYAVVVDASSYPSLYKNGTLDTWTDSIGTRPFTFPHVACDVSIGARWAGYPSTAAWFTGLIDEVRISNVARDTCWLNTEYNNENIPGTYVTVDPEQAVSAYAFRRPITIPDSMTPASCGANLPNFPVLVSFTDVTLKSASNGGNVQSTNGYDIVFRAADGITVLDHEIERYIPTTGELVAWVRIPSLAFNAATTIYMYYGNATITSATANPTGVWNTTYGWRGVWHMSEASSAARNDSTSNANNLSQTGSVPLAAGKIAGAASFDGTSQYLSRADGGVGTSLDITGALTVEAWVSMAATQTDTGYILNKWRGTCGATTNPPYYLRNNNLAPPYRETLQFAHTCGPVVCTGPDCVTGTGPASMNASTFYHLVGVNDGSNMTVYRDGSVVAGPTAFTSGPYDSDGTLYVGIREGTQQRFTGLIDELRLSATARDACWVGTEYNSMATPATVGVQAANAPTAVEMVSLDATGYPGRGAVVSWRTGFEVDNLGFHVYREVNGERVRLTPSLVAGSALFAGAGTPLTAGRSYTWWDRSPVSRASYWVEEWELSGETRWHGPVSVQPGVVGVQAQGLTALASGGSVQGSSPLLAGLGQSASGSVEHRVRRRLQQGFGTGPDRLGVQWGLVARPAVKLLVSEDGWTRVSQEELVRAGLDPSVDPSRLQLFADGEQVPILVVVRQPGVFGSGDGIEFYGEGLDTPATAVRVYWLTVGAGEGLRIPEASGGGQWAPGPASFPAEVERADRTLYFPALLNGDEDNFFGAVVTATPVVQIVRVPHVDQSGPGELVVRLQGGTLGAHRVGVELNGTRVGTVIWEGMVRGELSVAVGGHMILEGDNRVVLVADGREGDISTVESIAVRYQHTWEADGEELKFSLGGYQEVTISGFAGAQIKVLDITDLAAVQALPVDVVKNGEAYQARVGVPEPGERVLLAVGTGAIRHPVGVLPNRPTAWHQAPEGADLLIIGHRSLLPALEPLRALRETQGLKVAVVDVESVYDEFSFGAKSPQAIKDFLAYVKEAWSRPPRYLLLVGDASYDPRSYLGQGYLDLMPTKLVDTTYLETASDDWFADFDEDGIADIPVGRFPVQSLWEATTVVGKIVAYEGSSGTTKVLLVVDANDKGNDFEGLSGQVKAVLPSTVTVAELLRGQLWDAATSQLASQLTLGQTVVNYIGHGSNELWHGNLLTTETALRLKHDRLPLWLPMTCLNGYFQAPYGDSLAEALLKAPAGGAVAVWASSGLTETKDQLPIDEALVRTLFSTSSTTLGDATLTAKKAATNTDVRTTWILFGDPTTKLRR